MVVVLVVLVVFGSLAGRLAGSLAVLAGAREATCGTFGTLRSGIEWV